MNIPVSTQLPTKFGRFIMTVWPAARGLEPVMLRTQTLQVDQPVLVRLHSECLTGDTFGSFRCDCGPQKERALKLIAQSNNGLLLYLRQEGRGIGLYEKIKAYQLQERGYDTHEANVLLGHKPDQREYSWVKTPLTEISVTKIRLLTNNPEKMTAMRRMGFTIVKRVPLIVKENKFNKRYLESKLKKFGHFLRATSNV